MPSSHSASLPAVSELEQQAIRLLQENKVDEVHLLVEKMRDADPDHLQALHLAGIIAGRQRRFESAIQLLQRALEIAPTSVQLLGNLGVIHLESGDSSKACDCFEQALVLAPNNAEMHYNLGVVFAGLRQWDKALTSFSQTVTLNPNHAAAHNYRGIVLYELMQLDAAHESYSRALALNPQDPSARWNRALLDLLLGDYFAGWKGYEARWDNEPLKSLAVGPRFSIPRWTGDESLANKVILVDAEQGLGDTLQFCRYLPLLAARGARVMLQVQRPLVRLLHRLPGVHAIADLQAPVPQADFRCPLLSLPRAFRTRLDSIPAATPYLHPDPALIKRWENRLGPAARPRVGLVWSGGSQLKNDASRSIPFAHITPLLHQPFEFFSMQKEVRPTDRAAFDAMLRKDLIYDYTAELEDFSDTAALCATLDLIISVDTSVVHLAGALGRPVWILLPHRPDWRWLTNRTDSPWYPSARLFRQPAAGDWPSVITTAGRALNNCFSR